jgi:hypothetical protein
MAKQKPSIYDLVSKGIIKVGQTFFARDYVGTIVGRGHFKIEYAGEGSDPKNMENRLYDSFNEPTKQICGYPVNAWLFWKYFKGEEQRPIDDWRQEWLDKYG